MLSYNPVDSDLKAANQKKAYIRLGKRAYMRLGKRASASDDMDSFDGFNEEDAKLEKRAKLRLG